MNPSNDLMLTPSKNELEVLQTVATQCAQSGFYKRIGGVPQLIAIALTARELGLPLMASINGGINIIEGRPEISARMLNALILRAGGKIQIKKLDDSGCWLVGVRGDQIMEASFTWYDAVKAGLSGKKNWVTYRQDMLWSRAISRLSRRLWADLIGAAYVEGEISGSETVTPVVTEEVQEIKEIHVQEDSKEVEEFIESFGEDKDNFKKYMDYVLEYYKGQLTAAHFVKEFKEKHDQKMPMFQLWKEKHAA